MWTCWIRRSLTLSHPAELQLKRFVFHFVMNYVDSGRQRQNLRHLVLFGSENPTRPTGLNVMLSINIYVWKPRSACVHCGKWINEHRPCLWSYILATSFTSSLQVISFICWETRQNTNIKPAAWCTLWNWDNILQSLRDDPSETIKLDTWSFSISVLAACLAFPMAHPQ